MKKFLSRKLEKFIYACIEKYEDRAISPGHNPYQITLSAGASLKEPLRIGGDQYISIGRNSLIGKKIWLEAFDKYLGQVFTPEITIGENVYIGNYACITAINSIKIGNGCLISEYVYISDHSHGVNPGSQLRPSLQNLNSKGPVLIGENTFLGFRVCVLPGVQLGKNCVVGANSVVTKSFPDNSMIGGIPAKLIKQYSFEENDWVTV